ncbi:hypothetical protein VOLCADRAFT_107287 [Volvox carteri f. nagariensis]|uniref:Uncharacterized protein n=1 Tax=Volvox carteri f. nagariensis TaxID=3068 RepID=D8UD06_VOLCA|nr:uncharacterized protein VOLCADRAFT_107287 [Volvox carteri f. nagariensis]EFJ42433.1 hypothetical protein VOLCADRAFT_107287 [Volvox carteri f. nagariensis]|eukprot:XP_002956496.1 hypothetical protein VOLCADRAFT_107287 [Volvox carteri f. nagariensis]
MRFHGYTQAVSQHFVKRNAGKSLKVGARALKKTHRHFVSMGSVMQAMYRMLHLGTPHKITQKQFNEAALQTGCKGLTAFAALPYVDLDLSCLFTVSTGHALLFGVVSDFVDYTLKSLKDIKPADPDAKLVMSREARQRVVARSQFLVVTSDFRRRYKCIMQYRKSYHMEDWLHFVEMFSSYIFKGDVLPEALWALCWSLCSTVTHYFWPRPPDETREQFLVAAKAAACKLRAYTTRLEELEVPGYMFTVNLHICVCRLYDQECQLGSTAGFSDLPVERMMQQMKTQGGRMVSQAPEKHYMQWLCLMWASESLTEADPVTGAKHTTNQQLERMLARRAVNTEAAWFDKPGANEQVAQVRAAMASLVHWYALAFKDVASWTLGPSASYELDTDRLDRVLMPTPPDCPKARSFLRAEALNEEQYFGAEYGCQQQRTSCWACYQAEVGNKTRTYAAYLKYFVHLPAEDGAQDVRFTVADVYSGQVFSRGLVVVNMAATQTARAGSQWEMWQDLGLPLSHLICRLKASLCMALYKTGGPEGLAIGGPTPGKATATSNFMTQFQKKVLDKILRPSTITADHGAVAAAVGAEAVDTAANDGDGAAARAAAGDHEQAVGGGEAAAMGTHAVDGGTGGGRTAGIAAAATAGGDTGTGPRQGKAGVAQVENLAVWNLGSMFNKDEDTTNYDAFKEWVGEVPRAAKGAAGKRRRGGGDDDNLGARSGRKVGNKRQKGNKGAGRGRGASKGTTRAPRNIHP